MGGFICGTAADMASREGHTEVAQKLRKYASQFACCSRKGVGVKLQMCGTVRAGPCTTAARLVRTNIGSGTS